MSVIVSVPCKFSYVEGVCHATEYYKIVMFFLFFLEILLFSYHWFLKTVAIFDEYKDEDCKPKSKKKKNLSFNSYVQYTHNN